VYQNSTKPEGDLL